MFQQLHTLAKDATLLITARAEGDQLRITVTPTKEDGKKSSASNLRPLSVIATPDELDADFAQALTIWQGTPATKRSVLEQAQEASEPDDDEKPADKKADKKASLPAQKKTDKAPAKDKPKAKAATTMIARSAAAWPLPTSTGTTGDASTDEQASEPSPDASHDPAAPPEASEASPAPPPQEETGPAETAIQPPAMEPPASQANTDFSLDLF